MKKHFLFLLLGLLTLGFTKSYGQLVPRAITCLPADALHPIAGQSYTYSITVPTPIVGTKKVLWYATQDPNFITAGTLNTATAETTAGKLLAVAGAGYNVQTDAKLSMDLTWKSINYNAANPIFVVVNVINDDGSCTPNNLKVYEIQPVNAFTLDIANINGGSTLAGYGSNVNICLPNVVSAIYNSVSKKVEYDYGQNYLYYEVVAANWSGQWRPKVRLTGLDPNEKITVEWSKDKTFAAGVNAMAGPVRSVLAADNLDYTSAVNVTTAAASVGSAGESIYIRVTLDHADAGKMYEGLTDEAVSLAVDGNIYFESAPGTWDVVGPGDVHHDNGPGTASPCPGLTVDGFANDIALQTVKARPDVQPASGTFIPVAAIP